MGDTKIEWTDKTWNPVVGCEKVSQGCKHCYAKRDHDKRHLAFLAGKRVAPQYAEPFEVVQLKPERLDLPLRWRKPQFVFVNSVSDLFHKDVPFEFIDQVFGVMLACGLPRASNSEGLGHTFQILTKRPKRMHLYFQSRDKWDLLNDWAECARKYDDANLLHCDPVLEVRNPPLSKERGVKWPLPNVWLGVSVENQAAADERVPLLLECPAAVHWISAEPLLGPVDFDMRGIDGIVVGGESGKGARPMNPVWVRGVMKQCQEYEVPFFFKQWGEWGEADAIAHHLGFKDKTDALFGNKLLCAKFARLHNFPDGEIVHRVGKKTAGRLLDGREWNDLPDLGASKAIAAT